MGFIKINSISFQPAPTVSKDTIIMYKLASDPDIPASYTVYGNVTVPVGGVLSPAFIISGLADATEYTIRGVTTCGNHSFKTSITTGVECATIVEILENDLIAYWGWKSSKTILTEIEIVQSPNYQFVTIPQDIQCSFAGGFASPMFLWMAEPILVVPKINWEDIVEPYNHGKIETDQDLFSAPSFSGSFRFYITEYLTQQSNTLKFKTS